MTSFAALALVADRFEILRPLGAGGLAEVYAARDVKAGGEVAIKILHAHLAHDEKLAERFRREMAVARSLDHPGIVRVFDLHLHGARPLLSMELLRGRTLAERLEQGRMERGEAFRVARDMAEALRAAHRAGVVHRDLKPQNVFLCEGGTLKLLDFGLARAAGWVRLSAQSTLLGTPSYMAPELFAGHGADARADLYSLGATIFEMLTGRQAFAGADPFALMRLKGGAAPSPRAVEPSIAEADDKLVRRALDPDPEKRFLDAGQMLRALDGQRTPEAAAPPPAIAAGEVDVHLHGSRGVDKVLDAVGAPPPPSAWKARLHATGSAVLVSGVSRATAETMAAICQEQGLGAALEPTRPAARWSRHALGVGLAGGALGGAASAAIAAASLFQQHSLVAAAISTSTGLAITGIVGVVVAGAVGLFGWAAAGGGAGPALHTPEGGDPALGRLREGIACRVARIQALAGRPGPGRPLMAELEAMARSMLISADELARAASAIPDPLASADPEAITLPPGQLEKRDGAVARLLEIAAALDEVLVLIEAPHADAGAQAALRKLLEETAFARQVLAEVRDARSG